MIFVENKEGMHFTVGHDKNYENNEYEFENMLVAAIGRKGCKECYTSNNQFFIYFHYDFNIF